jgi:hypothetical protein
MVAIFQTIANVCIHRHQFALAVREAKKSYSQSNCCYTIPRQALESFAGLWMAGHPLPAHLIVISAV